MGSEIDRLEVQVEAQATKANNQLDKLVGKLDSLSNSLSHINSSGLSGLSSGISKFAQASSQLSNVKTADFTRLTKNIQSLSNLNTQQIYGAASAMRTLSTAINSLGGVSANSMQVAYVAKDISKLGGVNVQRAITNLPLLATAMNNLMATLSKAPSVNRNIIDMTNALANLASQGNRVGSSSNSIVNGLNRTSSAMARTRKSSISLAAAFGKFYASWWLVIRGASKLWDSIENSMNYVETLNYFDAAFGQVADSAVSQWEEAGYLSADAYYNSFSSRAKELTSKMTGFNVNDDGTLTATGNASLGINPTKLMNYQATFAQMSSSIGVASETSLLLSQALTELGADLASVKNMDFDKVWKDMASGLAGMSRTLDKYGVNIRNVNLQQKLFDLGINENITNLNQNDKALLRAIILLDSTRYAWGDLADTLNQPANQMRLLDSNLNNLSRTIGNLFLPIVSKVLPYVNGLVIGLQRLFTWVGNLLGIDISGITSAVGDGAFDIGELVDETDDLAGSLGDATKAAEKLKRTVRGFDELNVISTQTNSGGIISGSDLASGLLDDAFANAFSEYQKAWDEAFANMENRANDFADKVEKFLQPVRYIIEDFAIGDFFKAGQDTSNLVAGIFNFFADAIDKVNWKKIGNNIGDYLAGINWGKVMNSVGKAAWQALRAAIELWSGMFEKDPFGALTITFSSIVFKYGYGLLTAKVLSDNLGKAIGVTALKEFVFPIAFVASIMWIGKNKGEETQQSFERNVYSELGYSEKEIERMVSGSSDLRKRLQSQNDNTLGIWKEKLSELKLGLENFDKFWKNLADEGDKKINGFFDGLRENANEFDKKLSGIKQAAEDFDKKLEEVCSNIGEYFGTMKTNAIEFNNKMIDGIKDGWNNFLLFWKNDGITKWYDEKVKPMFDKDKWTFKGIEKGLGEAFENAIGGIKSIWNTFANWLNEKLNFSWDGFSIAGKEIIPSGSLNLGKIPTFKLGGFPEDGWFRASKGEFFGQFDDGTSYIANNNQIVDGVAAGVEEAAYRGMMRALSESGGVTIHVEGDSSGMYKVWKEEYKSEAERLQKNPVPIF